MPTTEELLALAERVDSPYQIDEIPCSASIRREAAAALRSIASDLPTMLAEERAAGREEAAGFAHAKHDWPARTIAACLRGESSAFADWVAREHCTGGEVVRCEYCDGTGDVTAIDGEWRGYCTCPAGVALFGREPRAGGEGGRDA